jgi:hypothetical protein
VVLTCVLALVSTLAVWLRALVLDTHAYVKAVGPVLEDKAVRDALAGEIVDELYQQVDVAGLLRDSLPAKAATFAPTIAASIHDTSVTLASNALGTKQVRRVWEQANRLAHDQIVHVLEGKGRILTTRNGEVAIETGPIAGEVRDALDSAGIHVFDSVDVSNIQQRFVLFRSTDLQHAQQATRVLDALATWLPFVTIGVGAVAILTARHRRRTIEILALGIATTMVVIVVGIAIGRSFYLDAVGSAIARPVAAAPFDALVGPLRTGVRMVFALALVAWAAAWLTGSNAAHEHERRAQAMLFPLLRRHARPLAIGGAVATAVVLVAWDRPRPIVLIAVLGVLAVWEAVIAIATRQPPVSTAT